MLPVVETSQSFICCKRILYMLYRNEGFSVSCSSFQSLGFSIFLAKTVLLALIFIYTVCATCATCAIAPKQ